ncbi:MAG: hypothetical protein KJ601_02045 [Nanoarchaeota archaeon]|nr:hypothetical protein [Nanoarchaeota archaeon]
MRVLAILSLIVLFVSGCTIPSYNHVCPDGEVVSQESECSEYSPERISLDPDDYPSVELEKDKINYVKINGDIKTTINIKDNENGWFSISQMGRHGFKSYTLMWIEPDSEYSDVELKKIGHNTYEFDVSAPSIQGEYRVGISKRNQTVQQGVGNYNLTVIGKVENETMAYI